MELYDKKYVYFDWDKELDGKKGFVAQNIVALKNQVDDNPDNMVTLSHSDDNTCPFTYYHDGEITFNYLFAYYDPYYEFRKAHLEGKQLQFKHDDIWDDVIGEPIFGGDIYRIKPENTYIPFNSVQELIDAWDDKYPQNKNRLEGTMPLIWIKSKDVNKVYLITDFFFDKSSDYDVGTEEENLDLKDLFNDFTFLDGSIIGKIKEQ